MTTTLAPRRPRGLRPAVLAASLLVVAIALPGCVPVLVGGAMVGGAMAVTDRRTAGAQIDDQSIELRAGARVRDQFGDRVHVNVTSYNRTVLLTGEVPTEADKAAVEQAVARLDNVRAVVNELGVLGSSSLSSRANDGVLSTKVKATLVDAKDVMANAFKVTAERGTIYLMGRVTEREASRASDLARSVAGVQRVVRVFEILTEAELAGLKPAPPPANAPSPAPAR